jgi:hypothetical protein
MQHHLPLLAVLLSCTVIQYIHQHCIVSSRCILFVSIGLDDYSDSAFSVIQMQLPLITSLDQSPLRLIELQGSLHQHVSSSALSLGQFKSNVQSSNTAAKVIHRKSYSRRHCSSVEAAHAGLLKDGRCWNGKPEGDGCKTPHTREDHLQD